MHHLEDHKAQQAVLQSVVAEEVGKAEGNHGAQSPCRQGPYGMLPRGTASEIGAGEQKPRSLSLGAVERKARVRSAIREEAPIGEQDVTQTTSCAGGQKASGDDLVRIHVVDG